MSTHNLIDVFIVHISRDTPIASHVRTVLEQTGLTCADSTDINTSPENELPDIIRDKIAEANAIVAIASPLSVHSPMLMYEIGAAFAWNKLCYIVSNSMNLQSLPTFLQREKIYSLSQLNDLAETIQISMQKFTDNEDKIIAKIYESYQTPVDRLYNNLNALEAIARGFSEYASRTVSREAILQRLVQLRKMGKLPRVKQP